MPLVTRRTDPQDANFEKLLQDALCEVVETELTPEKRRQRRSRADADELAFCRIYFPGIFDAPWNGVHRHIASLTQGKYTVSGFRRSGKSAYTYVGKAIRHIALGRGGIVNVSLRTQDRACERTAALSRLIQKNRLLVYDYGIEALQDAKGWHIFKSEGGQTHLVATSVNQGLRAYVDDDFKRFTLAIGDDLYDKESVRSETDNERVTEFVVAELWGQMEPDGLSIVLGNSISDACPIARLRARFPERHFSFPIIGDDGQPTWPERFDLAVIEEMKAEIPFDVWEGEYMDRPAEKGDVFDLGWLRSVSLALTEIAASITAVDPSYGESPAACWKAAVTVGATTKHEVVLLDVHLVRENYILFFDYLHALRERMPAHKVILFENDFSQWAFAQPYYLDWMERRRATLPIIMHQARELATQFRSADKESRILNLVHPHQTGMFLYLDSAMQGRSWEEYRKQYLSFGKAKTKLDGLDAAATAYIMIFAYLTTGAFRPLAKRTQERPTWMRGGFH